MLSFSGLRGGSYAVLILCLAISMAPVLFGQGKLISFAVQDGTGSGENACGLWLVQDEVWKETNGVAGLQTEGANPDTKVRNQGPQTWRCNLTDCEPENTCNLIEPKPEPNNPDFLRNINCTCTVTGTFTPCSLNLTVDNKGTVKLKNCSGECAGGATEPCDQTKLKTKRTVTNSVPPKKPRTYHVERVEMCDCPIRT